MDIRICLLLAAEAGLALVLLWSAGVLRKPAHVLCAVLLLAAAYAVVSGMVRRQLTQTEERP